VLFIAQNIHGINQGQSGRYTRSFISEATRTGLPIMRSLIFAYPDDVSLYDTWDEYLYGSEILVAPWKYIAGT